MRVIKSDFKHNECVIEVTNPEDFWYLGHIIDKNDLVKARTFRKIKIGSSDEKSGDVIKKPIMLEINVEKVETTENSTRISGKITNDVEDIRKGAYHTITLDINSVFTIKKSKWLKFQLEKIKDSCQKMPSVLIIAMDRDQASFALLKKYGYEYLTDIHGDVERKIMKSDVKNTFYNDVIKQIKEYSERYNVNNIIVASSAFWKEDLLKEIKDKELAKKIITATCYHVGRKGIDEVINRDEIKKILKEERIVKEAGLVEETLKEIAKDNLAAYSFKYVHEAASAGAVKDLLITDSAIHKFREENRYNEIDELMSRVENANGTVNVISSEHEAGKRLNGLGGIAAILRYKMHY